MGSFDGTEIREIVVIYLLEKLSPLLGKESFDLYRGDGLPAVNSSSSQVIGRMKNDIISIFKHKGLSITIEENFIETDFWMLHSTYLQESISHSERLIINLYI